MAWADELAHLLRTGWCIAHITAAYAVMIVVQFECNVGRLRQTRNVRSRQSLIVLNKICDLLAVHDAGGAMT